MKKRMTRKTAKLAAKKPAKKAAPKKAKKAKKKKKLTRNQLKEREVRRKLRHIEWLNSPKGTPHPVDTDDEASAGSICP